MNENESNFKQWFDGSVIVSPKGQPLVLYHGTRQQFNEFDVSQSDDDAIFFTPLINHASHFGDVKRCVLAIKNPMVIHNDDLEKRFDAEYPNWEQIEDYPRFREYIPEFVKEARAKGHDGLIIRDFDDLDLTTSVYLAFSGEQVRPADGLDHEIAVYNTSRETMNRVMMTHIRGYAVARNNTWTVDNQSSPAWFMSHGAHVQPSRLHGDYDVFIDHKHVAWIFENKEKQIDFLISHGYLNSPRVYSENSINNKHLIKESAMQLRVAITNTDNAAFVDMGVKNEVTRILREAAEKIEDGDHPDFPLRDVNGNSVGRIGDTAASRATVSFEFNYDVNADVHDADHTKAAYFIRQAADKIDQGLDEFVLRDENGNKVGNGYSRVSEVEQEHQSQQTKELDSDNDFSI